MEVRKLLDNGTNFDNSLTTRKILFLLHKNDPSVRHVDIKINSEDETEDNNVLLPQFGRAIAKSTNLTSLHLFMARGPNTEEENSKSSRFLQSESNYVKRFLDEIRENRCIQNFRLEISTPYSDHDRRFKEVLENMNSLIEKNDELKSIDITSGCLMDDSSLMASVSNALRNRSRPIEQIRLCRIGRIPAGAMMLDLSCIYDPVIPPKKIILESNGVENWGCSMLSSLIRCKLNELEEITMIDEGISDDGLEIVTIALCIKKMHLKKLAIEANSDLGSEGLIRFVEKFSSIPELLPDNLSFSKNSFGSVGLKKLGKLLSGRNHPLESLHLNGPGMSEDRLEDFFEILETNPIVTPKMLHVSRLYIGVTELLRKQNCPLKRLHIDTIDDDEASRLARSLKYNRTLIEIVVYDDTMFLYGYGWRNIACLLCNTRHITATNDDSNHTLAKFNTKRTTRRGSIRQPLKVHSYLAMNSLSNKKVVAKMKVIECHFARNFILDQFTEMKPSVVVEVLSFVNQGYCAGEENGWTPNRGFFDDEIAYNNNMTIHFLMLRGIPGVLVGAGF